MSAINRFKNRVQNSNPTTKLADFIEKSLSKRRVATLNQQLAPNDNFDAVMTNAYREGGDEFVCMTYLENLKKGNYITEVEIETPWVTIGSIFLVYKQYNHPLRNSYDKFQLLECQHIIKIDDEIFIPVHYAGALRSVAEPLLRSAGSTVEFDSSKPIIIFGENENIQPGQEIILHGEAFIIKQYDRLTNPGIVYASLQPTTIKSYNDVENNTVYTEEVYEEDQINTAGSHFTVQTHSGYCKFNYEVEIISKTSQEVKFIIPYGIDILKITTKDINGTDVITHLEVN